MSTYDDVLKAAKNLDRYQLGSLIGELNAIYENRTLSGLCEAVRAEYPTAAVMALSGDDYDNGEFLRAVAILDAAGQILDDDEDRLRDCYDEDLTEINDPAGNGTEPHIDLVGCELHRERHSSPYNHLFAD